MTKENMFQSVANKIRYSVFRSGLLKLTIAFSFFQNCDSLFEYSPYQVKADGEIRNETAVNNLKAKSKPHFRPFKIALIGDSHTFYDDFKKQVDQINRMDSIDFVVHMGDITLSGNYREFLWYSEIISRLNKPIITIIGNHDCLVNGESMFKEMFGDFKFTCEFNNCKLIFWDDNIWERNNKDPDFEWLQNVTDDRKSYIHKVVFAHIPPWDDQFSLGNRLLYNNIIENNGVSLSVHGHMHKFQYEKHFGKVPYLLIGDATDREIIVAEILYDSILVNRVHF